MELLSYMALRILGYGHAIPRETWSVFRLLPPMILFPLE